MNGMIAAAAGIVCLLAVAGCDNTYTPSAHHQADVSTGTRLSGTDTGVSPSGGVNDPAINANPGGPGGGGR